MGRQDFLTADEEQEIVDAISATEKITSGEIRVHLENKCDADPLERARDIFKKLEMGNTEQHNGVLVYVAIDDHKVAVYGGKGIHEHVGQSFWDDVVADMIGHFSEDRFKEGLEGAIHAIGEKLKDRFPYQDDDVNELKNDISYNDNSDD